MGGSGASMSIVLTVFVDNSKVNSSTAWNVKGVYVGHVLASTVDTTVLRRALRVPDGAHACFLLFENTHAQLFAS